MSQQPRRSVPALVTACVVGGSAGWALTASGAGETTLAPAYGISLASVGFFTTLLAATYAALQVPAGSLVDRIGVRAASLAGLTLAVLAHCVAAVAPVFWVALVCRAVAGAGYAVCFVSGAELSRRSGAGAAGIGIFGGVAVATCGAAVVGVPLAEPLLGWRTAWVTSALTGLVALAAIGMLSERRLQPVPRPMPRAQRVVALPLWRDSELHRLAAVHAVTLGLGVVLSNWVALILRDTWGFGRTPAALAGSVVLGAAVLSRPLGGVLVRRLPHRTGQLSAGSLLACSAATVALAVPTVPVVAVLAVVVLGVLGGLPFTAVIMAGQARRPDRPAAAVGLLNGHANAVIVVGAPLLGAAIDHSATTPALLAVAAVWLLPLLARPRHTLLASRTAPAPVSTCGVDQPR